MAASSPVLTSNNNKVGEAIITSTAINGSTTPQRLVAMDTPPKTNQRGHNKPRCIKCGNVARSRCPFQSCKNCCAKAQNPCHIHFLKQSSILPAQPPTTTPLPEQPSTDGPSTGASWRLSSLRKLSATFASTMRVKKPLTRKDAVNINKWRFSKLKEHVEGNVEAENEAFDRYTWNVRLLEETFSTEGIISDGQSTLEPTSSDKFQKLVASLKVKLMGDLVSQQLRKLQGSSLVPDESSPYADELDAGKEHKRRKKEGEWRAERTAAFSDLIDKLSKARSEDDLKPCLEMKVQLLNRSESKIDQEDPEKSLLPKQEPDTIMDSSVYSAPKICTAVHMNQVALSNINAKLSSLVELAEL
ncbi:LOW QUALITY PROTEIN: uncharacterized protein LOC109837163 [Asparagus officinalis]|uniref:LOW QUALITY PROTEIN: uncharacterized protein LOC109837163 n=1 Tax=Asparagus officinalis TaxID=4686 RepID=UPI00098E452A|nr:LOW QUALITY PROTEIN: uncharacterized protein LOC109837163 [Asparagus officinalis]